MQKAISLAVSILLLLCGCNAAGAAPSSAGASSASSSQTATPIPVSESSGAASAATPIEEPTPTPSPNLPSTDELAEPSFLSEEQQELYKKAKELADILQMQAGNLTGLDNQIDAYNYVDWGGVQFNINFDEPYEVEIDGTTYTLFTNSYQEFYDVVHGIFTDSYLESTNYSFAEKYIDYEGRFAGAETDSPVHEGYWVKVVDNCPDTYIFKEATDDCISFTLVSHYDRNHLTDNETLDIYTVEYPIKMIKTADGWRFDEFHTSRYG